MFIFGSFVLLNANMFTWLTCVGCTAWDDGAGFRSMYAMRSSITKPCETEVKKMLYSLQEFVTHSLIST